jgi:hypothetical protein
MINQKTMEFIFIEDPEYRRIHATGVWGSLTPLGDLQFDLTEDVPAAPDKTILKPPMEIGQPTSEESVITDPRTVKINRHRLVGVTMPMSLVPSIIQWLQDKVVEHEANKKSTQVIPHWREN